MCHRYQEEGYKQRMVLVDTSVWNDHFNIGDSRLITLLENNEVFTHPFIIGEIAYGNIKNRDEILQLLADLPEITTASHNEILFLIDQHTLYGKELGYIEVHLVASCMMDRVHLYTRDKRLHQAAKELNVG